MRALLAIAALAAFGTAGLDSACASEWQRRHVAYYPSHSIRAPHVVFYDVEPDTGLRAYWARPWRGRHYYPFTGKKPKVGRLENPHAKYPAPKPAPSYYREWSTLSLYPPHAVMPPADVVSPLVPLMPPK
ncbi:MAG: hypothetical protein KIT48_16270 [Pseudolabrys sp.]|nr:hypothetical protein [Pseudolabrys sp.]